MIRDALEVLSRTFAVFRRRSLDRDFNEEVSAHLELLTDQLERRGLPRPEARRQAILQLGGLNETRDLQREARGLPFFERCLEAIRSVGRDLVHATRSLARARAFTLVCVVSLGVGMGAFVAIVTLVRAFNTPPPGIDPSGLVELLVTPLGPLRAKAGAWAIADWSYPDFRELRRADTGMTVTGWAAGSSEMRGPAPDDAAPARVPTLFVSANYFSTVGVLLARGPGFAPEADDPSAPPQVVVNHEFWRSTLNSDPDIVGKTLTLDGVPHIVAGITPEGFRSHFNFLDGPRSLVFVPLERHPRLLADPSLRFSRDMDWVRIHGRLARGIDIAQANAHVSALMSGLAAQYPASNEFKAGSVEPYDPRSAVGRYSEDRRKFDWFLGLAGMVLLIVCLNISGMMLVRAATRERELSVRQAIGAGRRRLGQYLLFEAVLLAFAGGATSTIALFGIPAAVARWWLKRPVPAEMDFDAGSAAISIGLCFVVSLLFGLAPAIRFSRPNLISSMKDDAGGGGHKVGRVHRMAAAVQVGVAIPFLVVSGVLLDRVRTADFGFQPDGLAAVRLDAAVAGVGDGDAGFFFRSVRQNVGTASGVSAVSMADGIPIDFDSRRVRVGRSNGVDFVSSQVTRVAEGYLETIGVPLLRGRSIGAEDRTLEARVAVISQPLAIRLFADAEPIGERVRFAIGEEPEQEYTVVGVSADFATWQLTTERPQLLLPLPEEPATTLFLIARGEAGGEQVLVSAFQNAVRTFDPGFVLPRLWHPAATGIGGVTGPRLVEISNEDLVAESLTVAGAGGVVLVLAALGVFGVIGFMVATRTREIAVRVALGASRPRVLGLVVSDVVRLVIPGIAVGLFAAAALIRSVQTVAETPITVGSEPLGLLEPLIYASAAAIAVLAAIIAALPAARRAASVQPMVVIRSE